MAVGEIGLQNKMQSLVKLDMVTFHGIEVKSGGSASYSKDITVKGYTPVAIAGYGANAVFLDASSLFISGNSLSVRVTSRRTVDTPESDGVSMQVRVLYLKSELYVG